MSVRMREKKVSGPPSETRPSELNERNQCREEVDGRSGRAVANG